MTAQWYYQMMGAEFGPHTGAEMLELVRKHRISPEDLVRKGAQGDWVAAYRVPGLFAEDTGQRSASMGGRPILHDAHAMNVGGGPSASAQPTAKPHSAAQTPLSKPPVNKPPVGKPSSGAAELSRTARAPHAQPVAVEAAEGEAGAAVQAAAARALAEHDYVDWVERAGAEDTMAPPPLDWYCICHGEKLGPLTFRRLKELYAAGELEPQGRVWSNASPKWCRAHEVPGLG